MLAHPFKRVANALISLSLVKSLGAGTNVRLRMVPPVERYFPNGVRLFRYLDQLNFVRGTHLIVRVAARVVDSRSSYSAFAFPMRALI